MTPDQYRKRQHARAAVRWQQKNKDKVRYYDLKSYGRWLGQPFTLSFEQFLNLKHLDRDARYKEGQTEKVGKRKRGHKSSDKSASQRASAAMAA